MGTKRFVTIPPITSESLAELVTVLPFGKRVGEALYIHREAIKRCVPRLFQCVETLAEAVEVGSDFNVVKFVVHSKKISFLSYPDFLENPHPALKASVTIYLETGMVKRQDYDVGANAPILHRKEAMVEPSYPQYAEWKALTEAEERYGLYDETHRIGFRKNWEQRLARKGLGYEGHRLVDMGKIAPTCMQAVEAKSDQGVDVHRHKTALVRYGLSKPIQCLISHGLLREECLLLDYGCGRGDDVRYLNAMGYRAVGWDPVYFPQGARDPADIVNLGYVLNVIEEPREREQVVRDAYALAQSILVVSVLTAGSSPAVSGRPYRDGILTRRHTFQKYFRQHELRSFLEQTLGVLVVPAALGVFYVFKNSQDHQEFLSRRSRRQLIPAALDWKGAIRRPLLHGHRVPIRRRLKESHYEENQELLEAFWQRTLELGRLPLQTEFDRYGDICEFFGSAKRALRYLVNIFGCEALDRAAENRRNDLLVYVALSNFRRRVPFASLPENLQADVRFFFGSYPKALVQGRAALFAAGRPDLVARLCDQTPWGHKDDQALYIHSSLVTELHPILRVYIGCAELLCGEVKNADIVKLHKHSGKLTLLFYDDFFGKPFPELQTRVKVNLRTREVDIFDHRSETRQQVLFFKERYVAPEHPDRERWAAVSRALKDLGLELEKASKQELVCMADRHLWLRELLLLGGC